jgi:hypothetical protein
VTASRRVGTLPRILLPPNTCKFNKGGGAWEEYYRKYKDRVLCTLRILGGIILQVFQRQVDRMHIKTSSHFMRIL